MKIAIVAVICLILGTALGFGFMLWVAIEMVRKVRVEEDQRHTALLAEVGDQAGEWMDVVNDILDTVQQGKLSNRSVPDQVTEIRNVIKRSREQRNQTMETEHLE